MGSFFKTTFAVMFGIFISSLLAFFGFIMFASALSQEEPVKLNDPTVLKFNLGQSIAEIGQENPYGGSGNPLLGGGEDVMSLNIVLDIIDKAKYDENIKGIYLYGGSFPAGMPIAKEIRNALEDFKSSGKFIYAYANFVSEKGYYVLSVADKIMVNPVGGMELNGLAVEKQYFKDFFDKMGLKIEVFKVGTYKSFVEPYTQNKMSKADYDQTMSYLTSIYNDYLTEVSNDLEVSFQDLKKISNQMEVRSLEDALNLNLVTDLGYEDEMETMILEAMESEEESFDKISLKKYRKVEDTRDDVSTRDKIAVLRCEGNIVYGKGEYGSIGHKEVVKQLRKFADNDRIKAVVLRINSPGGSALASDIMWREIQNLRKKKPVVASMSTYAASGGYYMAMGCDKIVAYPNTITGSIGIFGMGINPSQLMEDKLGIHTYSVKTGEFSTYMSPLDGMTDEDRAIIQASVNKGYETFTTKAAEGRGMELSELKKLAEGRVWTGEQALNNGLVDQLGDLDAAVALASELAELEDEYKVRYYPEEKDYITQLMEQFTADPNEQMEEKMRSMLGEEMYQAAKTWENIRAYEGVQARLPYTIEIK